MVKMNRKVAVFLFFLLIINVVVPVVMAEEIDKENILTLDEVIVTASKYQEKLSEAAVSIEVINQEEIERKNVSDAGELLKGIPGINFEYRSLNGSKQVSIRGANTNQVLVLIDGQPSNWAKNNIGNLAKIPAEQIERIEIVKSPASALYGANALGGVINIITKSGSHEPITNVKLAYGSYDTREYYLGHSGRTNKLGYNIMVKKRETDGYAEDGSDKVKQSNIFTKFNYQLDQFSKINISLRYTDMDTDINDYNANEPYHNDEDFNLNLQWERQTDNNEQSLVVYHNQHDNTDFKKDKEHNTRDLGINYDHTNYYRQHIITYGLELVQSEIDSDTYLKHDNLNQALFIQDVFKINDRLKFNLGCRYDNHEEYGSEFSPKLGTVYNFNSKVNWYTAVGKAYRAPSYSELYLPQSKMSSAYYVGNPDLDPEIAIVYETGLRYLDKGLKTELSLFKRDVDDLIDYLTTYEYIDDQYSKVKTKTNINSVRITGFEVSLLKELNDSFSTNFNYTYLDARDEENDEQLDGKPYHTANLGLAYQEQDISSSVDCRFVGSKADGSEMIDAYFVVDWSLSKEIIKDTDLSLKINNLFDREYTTNGTSEMPGRNYVIELSKRF
ncbi:TonB-dependent receptor [Halocella sp. SP3-1]|nr:TonB-dependent receptor [Halocella sp. SP3-1]